MQTFGECSMSIGGRRRILRGEATFEGIGGLDTEVQGNMDGSVYQTAKTKPVTLKFNLEQEQDAVFSKADLTTAQDVTFTEMQNGRVHLMSSSKVSGSVSYNPASGELSGFSMACAEADYRRR